jgi:phosphoribosylformylglycinamidine synthase
VKAKVIVTLKNGVLDPQGKAIEGALSSLGFEGVNQVRQGKLFEIDLATTSADEARRDLTAMCDRLLANTVIESYRIELV